MDLKVELDVRYQPFKKSGISTYTLAIAEELAEADGVELVLRTGSSGLAPGFPDVPQKRMRWWENVVVRPGWVRLVPHQLRPPPLIGQSVITIHDVIYLGAFSSSQKRLAFGLLLRLFRTRKVGVIAVSHATRSRLISVGFDPTQVVVCQSSRPRRGPDLPLSEPSCGGGGVVYVGNLSPHKDLKTLTAAHFEFSQAHPGFKLHVVTSSGDAEVAPLLDLYAGVPHLLCLHRGVNDRDRNAVLHHAHVCVTPSLEEGFGYSIDEALLLGTPVIASYIPPHIENGIGREVAFFPPGDASALCAALVDALVTSRITTASASQSAARLSTRIPSPTALRNLAGRSD